MKTKYMRQVYMGTIGDIKNLELHFSRMAEKGWMIDKMGVNTHRYRAVEPCKKTFFVDILPQITAFDYPDNEEALDYRRICEESGWTFITANRQIHVFCAEEDTPPPVPIHTDNSIQAQIYLKACRKYELSTFIVSAILLCYVLFSNLKNGANIFLSNLSIFLTLGVIIFIACSLWTYGFIILWYIRTRRAAKLDLPLPAVSFRLGRIRNSALWLCFALFLICIIAGIVLEFTSGMPARYLLIYAILIVALGTGQFIRRYINTKKRDRADNIRLVAIGAIVLAIVAMVATSWSLISAPRVSNSSLDGRPALKLEDIGITDTSERSSFANIKGSVAVPINYDYWEISSGGQTGSVRTEVYRSVNRSITQALYRRFVETQSRYFTGEITYLNTAGGAAPSSPVEAAYWGADEGIICFYDDGGITVMLIRNKTILSLNFTRFSDEIESAAMDNIAQAAKNILNYW